MCPFGWATVPCYLITHYLGVAEKGFFQIRLKSLIALFFLKKMILDILRGSALISWKALKTGL